MSQDAKPCRLNVFGPLRKDQALALVAELILRRVQFSCIERDGSYTVSHPNAVEKITSTAEEKAPA